MEGPVESGPGPHSPQTGTPHVNTLIQHRAPNNPTQRPRQTHTHPREGPLIYPH